MKEKNLTLKYTTLQTLYWSAFCGMYSFAVAFLLQKGFKASEAGTILFCSNFLSFLLQPFVAEKADKATKNILPKFALLLCSITVICLSIMMIFDLPKVVLAILFFVGTAMFDMQQPLTNSLVIYYEKRSYNTNYGLGRGIGALGYGIASVIIGYIIESSGVDIVLPVSIGFTCLYMVVIASYPKVEHTIENMEEVTKPCSLVEFIVRYKWYVASLFGLLLLCMTHLMLENYLIEIFTNLGGGSSNIGIALFVATVTETVVLVFVAKIVKKAGIKKLLILGGLSYILKVALFICAKSIWVIYVAQVLQMTSYTFICPTQMYYAQDCTNPVDTVKGQSMSTAFWAMGGALGNLLGGVLISAFGLKTMLKCAFGIAVLGTVVFALTVPKALNHNK